MCLCGTVLVLLGGEDWGSGGEVFLKGNRGDRGTIGGICLGLGNVDVGCCC